MTNLKELSERLAWEALEKSGNTKTGRSAMREAADVLAALGETHVVVERDAIMKAAYDCASPNMTEEAACKQAERIYRALTSPDRGEHKNG